MKLYDICLGQKYQTQDGEKTKWQNVGVVMKNDKGNQYILLDKTFNPAGVNDGKDSVLLSMFEPKQQGQPQQQNHNPFGG